MDSPQDNQNDPRMPRQVVNVTASKDLRFLHIDAGLGMGGVHRADTIRSEVTVVNHYLQPAIDRHIRDQWPELKEAALTIVFHFV